ncbi:MAG: ArnT family glycosyltransferase [Blastocatellia bacterium]
MNLQRHARRLRRWLVRQLATGSRMSRRAKLIISLLLFGLAFAVRSLHAVDLESVMYTTNQPFGGLTVMYDARATDIVGGGGLLGPYGRPWQTQWLGEAPGYAIYLSAIYATAGRDFFNVQLVQNTLTATAPVLLFWLAGALLGWRVGVVAGWLAAVSHHLAHISNFILPDALCALPLLAALYLLWRTRQSRYVYLAYALVGFLCGVAAWLRPQPMLLGPFLVVMLALPGRRRWRTAKRALIIGAVALLVIAPITIRNYIVYREFVPISIGTGLNLWEGIGEASGDRFGAVATDDAVALQEAELYNEPRYGGSWTTPDGITRDRERVKKSLTIIGQHLVWYAGVMLHRCKEMVNYTAHAPLVFRAGQTSAPDDTASIRPEWRELSAQAASHATGKRLSWLRPIVRAAQRLAKEPMTAMIFVGALLCFILAWRRAMFVAIVPLYYFIFQSALHTEFRYTLPMQYFLFVFAAVAWVALGAAFIRLVKKATNRQAARHSAQAGD